MSGLSGDDIFISLETLERDITKRDKDRYYFSTPTKKNKGNRIDLETFNKRPFQCYRCFFLLIFLHV